LHLVGSENPFLTVPSFPSFKRKVGSGGLFLFQKLSLALGRAGVVILLLGLGRTFARLVRLGRVRLWFGLVSRRSTSSGFMGDFSLHSQYRCIDSLDEFLESCEGGQLVLVDPYHLDMFGESIVACQQSAACPLNTCG